MIQVDHSFCNSCINSHLKTFQASITSMMGSTQSKEYVLTARFLSVSEKEIDEIKRLAEHRLEAIEERIQIVMKGETVGLLSPYFIISTKIITILLRFLDEAEEIKERIFKQKINLKIDHSQMKFAVCTLQSDINTINNRIKRIQ